MVPHRGRRGLNGERVSEKEERQKKHSYHFSIAGWGVAGKSGDNEKGRVEREMSG